MIKKLPIKQPWERFPILFHFGTDLGEEDIESVDSVVIVDDGAKPVTDAMRASDLDMTDGQDCYVGIQGGVDGMTYKITVRIISPTGKRYELDANLPVREL